MVSLDDFDELDKKIIEFLCKSSEGSFRQNAKKLGIHPTTLTQRVRALEEKGVLEGYHAKLNCMNLGFEYLGIVDIHVDSDMAENVEEEL
ncbi:MAG: winged helix-turn-helix transcriptional regulator, partial [Candidatus Methanoplasma sp.]|nr:winged helix-turn-helix transcriptional regulator [Candidatus Methanoplasma sp.]